MHSQTAGSSAYRGRLAPSPTGLLHLGHARTFWVAAERARQNDGLLILRNEDLDFQRCRPEFVHAMLPDLAMIGRIETEVERTGKIEYETRYYLCSLALCALTFARAVRAHWGVENRLHWVLDVIFREDLARFRTGDGPQNMAIIRHTVLNLLSRAKPTTSLKNRRKRARWNVDYLETVIRQTA